MKRCWLSLPSKGQLIISTAIDICFMRKWMLLIICCSYTGLYAQVDSNYISSFALKNYLQVYAGSYSRNIQFSPTSKKGMIHTINLSPNSSGFTGFIAGYKKITLYGDVAIPATTKVNKDQTSVKAVSFFVSHFKNRWGVTGFMSYNRGLLMAQDNMPMMYGNRTDLRMFTTGVHLYRVFNWQQFSYIAASSQQMLQRKSAGSFVLITTPSYRIVKSSNSIIPTEISKYHLTGQMEASRRIQLVSLQVKPGYVYNFVAKGGSYFFAPSAYAGAGADYHSIQTASGRTNGTNLNAGYRVKLTTGINRQKFYATAEYILDHTRSYLYQSAVKNAYRECTLNVGWRF
jgi:hypothetical protein